MSSEHLFLSLNFNFDEKYFQGIYQYLTTLNVTNVLYSIVTKVTNVTNFCNNFQARAREGMCYVSCGIRILWFVSNFITTEFENNYISEYCDFYQILSKFLY